MSWYTAMGKVQGCLGALILCNILISNVCLFGYFLKIKLIKLGNTNFQVNCGKLMCKTYCKDALYWLKIS